MTQTLVRLESVAEARAWCAAARQAGGGLGFVPTMGALHEGHLDLVREARESEGRVVVSIFVNPLQFGDLGDLTKYPRDFERDADLLAEAGAAMVFTGTTLEFFGTDDLESVEREDPGPNALGLEGQHRPGHFEGVATIVRALFDVVRPTRAFFGAKDFQQTLVVRALAERMGYPEIEVCATVREADGLALSSRNARLDGAARERALALSRALFAVRAAWTAGERDAEQLTRVLQATLDVPGVDVEYAVVRDPRAFSAVATGSLRQARAVIAAVVGGVRLIDNLALHETS